MSTYIPFSKRISRERKYLKIYIPQEIVKKHGLHGGMHVEVQLRIIRPREKTVSKTSNGKTIVYG